MKGIVCMNQACKITDAIKRYQNTVKKDEHDRDNSWIQCS